MPAARPIVLGNWKMNGLKAEADTLVQRILAGLGEQGSGGTIGICPPAIRIDSIKARLHGHPVLLGGQDCAVEQSGAFTGDISARMLKDAGCDLVIVGHSERRHGHLETDATIRQKAEAALEAGLIAVVCIGETEAEWQSGETVLVLDRQLEGSLPGKATCDNLIVAYEPVWAIGTGRTPDLATIASTHGHLRRRLGELVTGGAAVPILYGGSVKASNAADILAAADVDGALVGGASLKADEFLAIFHAKGRSA